MRKVLLVLLLEIILLPLISQEKEQDAIIIYNKTEQSFGFSQLENFLYGTEILLKINRKIKILSSYGLEQFSTLYIPTYSDLDFKTEIISLNAVTISANGTVYKISPDAIKETTLPANVPFLKNYKGKVKSLAFENLHVGDEIQYDYEIKYVSSSRYSRFYNTFKIFIPEEYKIVETKYVFNLKNNIQFKGVVVNSNLNINKIESTEKGTSIYDFSMKNIEPYIPEKYSVEENDLPYIIIEVYKSSDYTPYLTWNDLTKDIKLSQRKSYFFAGKSVNDFYKETENEATTTKKILKIHDLMMAEMIKSNQKIYTTYTNYQADLEDANQIFTLLKLLDINGAVLLVKSKLNGSIIKDFVSLYQFDDLIIEFDDKGKKHYFSIFDPYAILDEINALYQGCDALRIEYINKKETVSFVKVPYLQHSKNSILLQDIVNVKYNNSEINLDHDQNVEKMGQFFIEDKLAYLYELNDKKSKMYSNIVKEELISAFTDCKVDTVILSNKTTQIGYQVSYKHKIYSENPPKMFNIKLSGLFNSEFLMSQHNEKRFTKAIFPNLFDITRVFKIKSSDGYKLIPNIFLKNGFNNELGYINCNYIVTEQGNIEITLNYGIKNTEILPHQWPKFLDFIKTAKEIVDQKIIFTR